MIFVDGENLVFRYQALLDLGLAPEEEVIHKKDTFLWHPQITMLYILDLIRVSYYTSIVGDDVKITTLKSMIISGKYDFRYDKDEEPDGSIRIVPHIFKKEKRSQKNKSVDINIVTDILRHTYNDSIDIIFLLSGDGDYIPVLEEVMRNGKQVYIGAFSNGLNPNLKYMADEFINLDEIFFTENDTELEKPV